jgi:DNA modification methylase
MPAELAEFFVRFLTDEGDLVVDPFAGSNTTGGVAEKLGRQWIAVEPDADYVAGSVGRFAESSVERQSGVSGSSS